MQILVITGVEMQKKKTSFILEFIIIWPDIFLTLTAFFIEYSNQLKLF